MAYVKRVRLKSALYIQDIKTGEQCIKIARRTKWVNYLEKNNLPVTISVDKKQELINFANKTVITQDIVEKLLEDNSWCQSNSTNF